MGKIVLFMGASSSGKDTIMRKLIKENLFDLYPIVMHTTRPKRTREVNGRDYYFVTEEEMKQLEEENKIIESRTYQTVYGPWHYFTTASHIDLDHHNYVASNTLEGLDQYLKYYSEEDIVSILIQTEDSLRLMRAIERERKEKEPKYEELCRRFISDCRDFSLEKVKQRSITSIIQNDHTLEDAMEEVHKTLRLYL